MLINDTHAALFIIQITKIPETPQELLRVTYPMAIFFLENKICINIGIFEIEIGITTL